MNDRQAKEKLRDIDRQRNLIGVGGYKNSRRTRNERHESFCKTMKDIEVISDKQKLSGDVGLVSKNS